VRSIRLVSWKAEEGLARKEDLVGLGYRVRFDVMDPGRQLRKLADDPPEAVVIDLSRSPAQGRDLGVAVRVRASTRGIPLVFAGGSKDKVSSVQRVLPDALFTEWKNVGEALERVWSGPPTDPVVPDSMLAGYSGTPLPRKLGIKPFFRVLLARAPEGFEASLEPLPEGVALVRRYSESVDLILWFVRSRRELERGIEKWASRVGDPGMWIIWPKKRSGISTDLQQAVVRRVGLDRGLVDYKIAALDQTWSGLKFAVRKKPADTA
jgi:hypothetical protein